MVRSETPRSVQVRHGSVSKEAYLWFPRDAGGDLLLSQAMKLFWLPLQRRNMDWKTYRRFTERDLHGRRVRTLTDLVNGYVRISKGTVMTITGKRSGLELEGEPCQSCGVKARISRVSPHEVEVIPVERMGIRPWFFAQRAVAGTLFSCLSRSARRRLSTRP